MTSPEQLHVARRISAFLAASEQRGYDHAESKNLLQAALTALDPDLAPLPDVDVGNKWLIAVHGPASHPRFNFTLRPSPMTTDEALVVAAWLVTLADPLHERFPQIERMVRNT